jgi:hypothetical protein
MLLPDKILSPKKQAFDQPSRSLLCDIMMYKNKDISTIPAIQWGLKHEATALSAYLKKFEETKYTFIISFS